MSEPLSQFYVSQRLKLHYVEWGDPEAPPLILLHGGRDHCRSWDWIAHQLRSDFRLIAPDLRGHGDSQWSGDGAYPLSSYVYDLAELIHQRGLAPVRIVAHSLGGNVALRYSGLYPENVEKLVAIEGLRPASPTGTRQRVDERIRRWIDEQRRWAAAIPRSFASIEEAASRMQEANRHLTPEQAHHLTVHGIRRGADGGYSWKFDNGVRAVFPVDLSDEEYHTLLSRIGCPTLLVYGGRSWASNPAEDGRITHFADARVALFEDAGHWVQHDQPEAFVAQVKQFLLTPTGESDG